MSKGCLPMEITQTNSQERFWSKRRMIFSAFTLHMPRNCDVDICRKSPRWSHFRQAHLKGKLSEKFIQFNNYPLNTEIFSKRRKIYTMCLEDLNMTASDRPSIRLLLKFAEMLLKNLKSKFIIFTQNFTFIKYLLDKIWIVRIKLRKYFLLPNTSTCHLASK